jgi:hypothetical protein
MVEEVVVVYGMDREDLPAGVVRVEAAMVE